MKRLVLLLIAILCMALTSCNEAVTPNEQSPEVATPDEQIVDGGATPDEVGEDIETEVVGTNDNIIILPEADENTKYITIEFPEDFPEEPYVEPNFVSPEEFEWGEYVPIVTYGTDVMSHDGWAIESSVLSSESADLKTGNNLYNEKYNSLHEYLHNQEYKFACLRRENPEFIENVGLFFPVVNGYKVLYVDGIEHQIKINEGSSDTVNFSMADSCNEKLWLVELFCTKEYIFATYLYNNETKENQFMGNHFFGASLSPCGKYLAYMSPVGELADTQSGKDYTQEKQGFYIKNLETENTVFYPCHDNCCSTNHGYHSITAWTKIKN